MLTARAAALLRTIRRHPWRYLTVAAFLAAALMLAVPQATAWYHFRQAKSYLAEGRTREAQHHLAACLRVWPDRVSVRLLSARAARQAGDFAAAKEHFARLGPLEADVTYEQAFEYALYCAAMGDLGQTESFLRPKIHDTSEQGPLACEALAEGYLRNYRGPEALQVLDVWQERQPDNPHALKLRGDVWRHVEALSKAAECYQRVLQLDPDHREARHWLALCLLDGGRPAEALPHWERLHAHSPGDVEVLTHLARCHGLLGQTEQAEHLLEDVLASYPDHVMALRTRGQLCLQQGRLTDAESALRRALRVAPHDYKTNERLYQVLRRQGRTAEAEAQREQVQVLESRWKHFREATRQVAEHPQDPALQCEMGSTLLDLGFEDVALGWLLSAVQEDPRCRRGHELLARWYENHRDADRAAYHRGQARALPVSTAASP